VAEDGTVTTAEETVPNIEVRIGAILSLERIAQDSTAYDKGRDHVRVMEILCAYVRENAKARKVEDFTDDEWKPLEDGASEEEREEHLAKRQEWFGYFNTQSKAWIWAQSLKEPHVDIALALTVLGRRTEAQRRVEAAWPNPPSDATIWPFDVACPTSPENREDAAQLFADIAAVKKQFAKWNQSLIDYAGYRLDLRGANLQRADLSDAILSGAKFNGARMEGVNFGAARMEGANLQQARMEGANLQQARIEGANLQQARMEGANLWQARMEGADL
jgi:hypothetical protein